MALYQGARFLPEQLGSIAAQQGVAWRLVVGDDGSTDDGPAILGRFATAHPGRVIRHEGPGRGAERNFRALIARTPPAGLVALCDQDDVWHPDKLARAAAALAGVPAHTPALYCSAATICDAALRPRGVTRRPVAPPSFRHALVQNLVQGNTAVLNASAHRLVQRAEALLTGAGVEGVVMHDWWIYLLVTGAGGTVLYDPQPSLLYRQHGGNVVGANGGARARLASVGRMLRGDIARWSRMNLRALDACGALLTPQNRALLPVYRRLLDGGPAVRLAALQGGGFHRQGRLSQAALWVTALLGRL